MAKVQKCEDCRYFEQSRGDRLKCEDCGDVFPCMDKSCDHIDCQIEQGSWCYICNKKIKWPKSDLTDKASVVHSIKVFRGGWHAIHEKCIEDEESFTVHLHDKPIEKIKNEKQKNTVA